MELIVIDEVASKVAAERDCHEEDPNNGIPCKENCDTLGS